MVEYSKRLSDIIDSFIMGYGIIETADRLGINKNTVVYHLNKARANYDMNTIQLVAEYVKRKVRAKYECKDMLDKSKF